MAANGQRSDRGGPLAGRELHFIAIGGAGMSALALVCDELGANVTGSDKARSSYFDRLRTRGLEPHIGHDGAQLPATADVVVSTAIPDDNVELALARERGQRVLHRGELLAELCSLKRVVAVSGTHGKTTTAGMLAHALRASGEEPAFVLGGELPGADEDGGPANAGWGAGEWIVVEADESDGSFLRLKPEVAVVTNVELDHHDRWRSSLEMREAFTEFTGGASGAAVLAGPWLDEVAAAAERSIRFDVAGARGPAAGAAELLATGYAPSGESVRARVDLDGSGLELRLPVPGRHNMLNALAALAAARLCGFDAASFATGLTSFPGMKRRLELKGEAHEARIFDDYAHHPTEVAAALEALRELGPRRLVAVFQPHLYSRTRALAAEFGRALTIADVVLVLDVYAAREQPVGELAGVSGLDVAREAAERSQGRPVGWLGGIEGAAQRVARLMRPGDTVVTLGAGDVHRVGEELVGSDATREQRR